MTGNNHLHVLVTGGHLEPPLDHADAVLLHELVPDITLPSSESADCHCLTDLLVRAGLDRSLHPLIGQLSLSLSDLVDTNCSSLSLSSVATLSAISTISRHFNNIEGIRISEILIKTCPALGSRSLVINVCSACMQ